MTMPSELGRLVASSWATLGPTARPIFVRVFFARLFALGPELELHACKRGERSFDRLCELFELHFTGLIDSLGVLQLEDDPTVSLSNHQARLLGELLLPPAKQNAHAPAYFAEALFFALDRAKLLSDDRTRAAWTAFHREFAPAFADELEKETP